MSKILVHEHFMTDSLNDIALLLLGKKGFGDLFLMSQFSEERVDLAVFSPACLPNISKSHVGLEGHVFGE